MNRPNSTLLFPGEPTTFRDPATDICLLCPLSERQLTYECKGGRDTRVREWKSGYIPLCPLDYATFHGVDMGTAARLATCTLGREMGLREYQSVVRQTVDRREMLRRMRARQ